MDEIHGTDMNFGQALEAMRAGLRVRLASWPSTAFLLIQAKTNQRKPFIASGDKAKPNGYWCWERTDDDILSEQWMVVR